MQVPELAGAADAVLPEPRLRFVRSEARAADGVEIDDVRGEGGARQGGIDALLVHAVPGLVPDGEETARQPVLLEAPGDADIVPGERDLEGMDRVVEAPAGKVVAHLLGHLLRECLLGVDRIIALENVDAGRRRAQRIVAQRNQRGLEFVVEPAQACPGHVRFIDRNQRIIGVVDIADRIGHGALDLHRPFERRREQGEILRGARGDPCRLRARLEVRCFLDQRRGNARQRRNACGRYLDRLHLHVVEGATGKVLARALDRLGHCLSRQELRARCRSASRSAWLGFRRRPAALSCANPIPAG